MGMAGILPAPITRPQFLSDHYETAGLLQQVVSHLEPVR